MFNWHNLLSSVKYDYKNLQIKYINEVRLLDAFQSCRSPKMKEEFFYASMLKYFLLDDLQRKHCL